MQTLVEGAKQWGIELSPEQVERFRVFREELSVWNQRMSLTSITEPDAVHRRHFLDSLSVLRLDRPCSGFYQLNRGPLLRRGSRVVDVGAGAGFPGLPVKIARPDLHLTLVESIGKKARFLHHVVVARAETLAHDPRYREAYDVALARGVASLRTLAELCLPFVKLGGFFAAHKKAMVAGEIDAALKAIEMLGGRVRWKEDYALPDESDQRCLLLIQKISSTPDRFPRHPGMPAKRPL